MPDIHIPELEVSAEEAERFKEARRIAEQESELQQIAAFAEWLAEQSETVQELGTELVDMQTSRRMQARFFIEESLVHGRRLWTASCPNGVHQSWQSAEHALFLLVDSFRVRAEDREDVRARLLAIGRSEKDALRECQAIGRGIKRANPNMPGQQRDAMVLAEVARREAEYQRPAPVRGPIG